MAAPILLATGSTAGGILIDFLRRQKAEIARWEMEYNLNQSPALKQKLDYYKAIKIIVLDVDGTNAYVGNKPLHNRIDGFDPGQFYRCLLPGSDLISSIEAGHHPGTYETIIPRAIRGLKSNAQGAGGTPPNGHLAYLVNQEPIRQKISQALRESVLNHVSLDNTNRDTQIFLIGTGFGGTASGSFNLLRQMVWQIADRMQIHVDFTSIFLIPGGLNQPKDLHNSLAVTAAWMKEQVARSTGLLFERQKKDGSEKLQPSLSRHAPTILLSDMNTAQEPHGLSRENQTSLVAQLLWTWITSPIGNRRDAQAADFQNRAATELSIVGEPKSGISAGISTIDLGRERLREYSTLKLIVATLSELIIEIEEKVAQETAKIFILKHQLLAGEKRKQLVDLLTEVPLASGSHSQATIARITNLIQDYTAGLPGLTLVTQGESQAQIAVQTALDSAESWKAVLEERQRHIVELARKDLEQRLLECFQSQGVTAAEQFLTKLRQVLKYSANSALKDNPHYEDQVLLATQAKEQLKTQLLERRKFNANESYIRALKNLHIAESEQIAHAVAIETLEKVQEVVEKFLLLVQTAAIKIVQLREQVQNELKHLVVYQPNFECPNGLYLNKTLGDLEANYVRILPDGGEAQAVRVILLTLLQQVEAINLLDDAEQLKSQLAQQAAGVLRPRLEGMHVISELRRRFPQETDLGKVLMECDRKSQEFIQLKDGADVDGLYVLRFLGIDSAQAGNLPQLVSHYRYDPRRPDYEVRDTNDPDKIIFWQERHLFTYSDWKHFGNAQDAYRSVSQTNDFEKLHPLVGSRYLLTPGSNSLSLGDAKALIIRAWVLGCISPIGHFPDRYQINATGNPIFLSEALTILRNPYRGYSYSVEIISRFNCWFLAKGARFIYGRLKYLLAVRNRQVAPRYVMETTVADFYTDEVKALLEHQLDWWDKNSIPSAMEWWQLENNQAVSIEVPIVPIVP